MSETIDFTPLNAADREPIARLLHLSAAPNFSKSAVFALDRSDTGAFSLAWRLRPRALEAVTELE